MQIDQFTSGEEIRRVGVAGADANPISQKVPPVRDSMRSQLPGCDTDHLQRVLIDDSPATITDVQILPILDGLDFVAILIARIKTLSVRHVSTEADPRIPVMGRVADSLN